MGFLRYQRGSGLCIPGTQAEPSEGKFPFPLPCLTQRGLGSIPFPVPVLLSGGAVEELEGADASSREGGHLPFTGRGGPVKRSSVCQFSSFIGGRTCVMVQRGSITSLG